MSIGEHQKSTTQKFRDNYDNIFRQKVNTNCKDGQEHEWSNDYFKKHCLKCGIDAVSLL